jgi:hypothetical protein
MKQPLTRFLMRRIPAQEQARLAADVIACRFSHLCASDQLTLVEQLSPRLLQAMREGRVGLPLLLAWQLYRRLGAGGRELQALVPDHRVRPAGGENGWLGSTTVNDAPADT